VEKYFKACQVTANCTAITKCSQLMLLREVAVMLRTTQNNTEHEETTQLSISKQLVREIAS
jgi:hypothetical protein